MRAIGFDNTFVIQIKKLYVFFLGDVEFSLHEFSKLGMRKFFFFTFNNMGIEEIFQILFSRHASGFIWR
jgi:hypothetical protein